MISRGEGLKLNNKFLCFVQEDHSTYTPGQISEVGLNEYEGCLQDTNISTQFPVSNLLVPHTGPIGLLGSKYLSNPYSLGGNSGI